MFVSLLIVDCLNPFLAKWAAELPLTLMKHDQGHNFYQDEHIPYECACIAHHIKSIAV